MSTPLSRRHREQPLDKRSPLPLYYQLLLRIQGDIQAGILRAGDRLGTEKEIQERYCVSRATVRKALDALEGAGQVQRITGRGTFVTEPSHPIHSPHLLSLTEELIRRGMMPGSELRGFDRVDAPDTVARALGVHPGDPVLSIRRLRTGDGKPIILVEHFLHPSVQLAPGELEQSLYATLERVTGLRLQEAIHNVSAGAATAEEAAALDIPEGAPVLHFARTTLAGGRPIVYERGTARPDRYQYSVHLFRT